jgi:hypothetical protein
LGLSNAGQALRLLRLVTKEVKTMKRLLLALALGAVTACVVVANAVATTYSYEATYIEPFGACAPGTSCGSASISHVGQSDNQVVLFNACGFGCHLRTVTFDDGSTLLIRIEDQPSGFAFTSPGNSGDHGRICFPGVSGNPQFLDVNETILGGTGRFAGATGSGSGTVTLHACIAIGKTSGTITLP